MDVEAKGDPENPVRIHGDDKDSEEEDKDKVRGGPFQPDRVLRIPGGTVHQEVHHQRQDYFVAIDENGVLRYFFKAAYLKSQCFQCFFVDNSILCLIILGSR